MGGSAPVISQTIQLALAPAFLLVGIGNLLGVFAGRLARVVDRSRGLMVLHSATTGVEHDRLVEELRKLDKRMSVINASILMAVASGVVVCLLVALLFVQRAAGFEWGMAVASAFVVAMLLLLLSLLLFLYEVRLAIYTIHVPIELLELEEKQRNSKRNRLKVPRLP